MLKESKNKIVVIASVVGVILVAIIIFLMWFNNRKFNVSFDLTNGTEVKTIKVKYNSTIKDNDILTRDDLGETFNGWFEVTKDGKLAEKIFDFDKKIKKDTKLKAVYSDSIETITVTFDTKGGSKIDSKTFSVGSELSLPKEEPVYKGYVFKGWMLKDGTPVYNKAILNESVTLYAIWEKKGSSKTTTTNKKTTTTTKAKTTEGKISYYCEDGFTLKNDKCVKTVKEAAKYRCPQGYYASSTDADYCVTYMDPEYESYCPDYLSYKASEAVLDSDNDKCYYRKEAKDEQRYCTSHGRVYYDGWCYYASAPAKTKKVCHMGKLDGSECKSMIKKVYYCDNNYTLDGKYCINEIIKSANKK